ncbi:retrotransposon protein, putative, ty1-copia subclass [Tanacetum coccineum]
MFAPKSCKNTAWVKGSKEIAGLMLMTMEPEIQRNLENLHANDMLKELKALFAQQAEQELLQTTRDFHACKQEEGQSVSSYVLRMKGYIDNLERLGHPVTLGLAVSLILIGLRKEFDGFVQNYNMHSLGKTVNELHAMLKLHEQLLICPKTTLLLYMLFELVKSRKPKIPPPPKREDPAKDSICHECGETGHWKRNCPQYLAELLKKKKNAASGAGGGSGIFVIELNTFLNRSWIYDTGCGTHICNTTQGLRASRKLKPGALSLYVGNGQREAVEAIGNFDLSLPSGLVIVLNNCHYAPSITRGVISVSRLYEDGFINHSWNNYNLMFLGYMVYFSANPKGEFLDHLKDHGIIAHRTPPYTPQHNGVSERRNRTLLDMVRSMMSQTTLPKSFWDYALETAARILNMVPTKKVEKTPYEVWHGQAPKLSYLKVWGCEALVKRDTLTKPDKLEPRSIKCIFIGYPKETMGYSFYYPPEINKVLVARNAEFLENSLINQEASGSLEDLEIIQEEDTHPSIDTSLNHEEDDLEIDEPQSDIIPIRRSTRTRRPTDRMCLYIDAEEHELGDLGEPANYKAALLDPESDKWLNAMNVEMQSMKDNEVWILVELPLMQTVVYMEQPEGFSQSKKIQKPCYASCETSIYGLKQASRQWNKRFDDEIKKFGFSQNADEPCVYLKASGSNVTFLILYVDDILIMGNSIPMLQDVKSYLGKCFAMKDLGEAAYILGIKIYRDRSRRLIGLCQSAYIEKILKADSHRNSNVEYTPCKDKLRLSNLKVPYTAELKAHCKCSIWPRLGVLLLCCEMYSPDVAFAQTYIADFNRIQLRVSCYTDAGYMTDADDLKSQTGYVFVLNGGAVDWKSAKQSIFATSSAEAEYIMPMMLLRKPFGLGNSFLGSVLDIFVPKVHTLRSLLKFGDIKLENIHIDDNLADPFTKSVSFSNGIQVLTRNIGCFS